MNCGRCLGVEWKIFDETYSHTLWSQNALGDAWLSYAYIRDD